jgi:hypothetical protein
MKLSSVLLFLSIALTQTSAQSSPYLCQNDLAPILCGINEEEFGNLCLARKEGGFEESDCTPKQTIVIDSQPSTVYLCNLYYSYKPVVCETTTEWNTRTQEVFSNVLRRENDRGL